MAWFCRGISQVQTENTIKYQIYIRCTRKKEEDTLHLYTKKQQPDYSDCYDYYDSIFKLYPTSLTHWILKDGIDISIFSFFRRLRIW